MLIPRIEEFVVQGLFESGYQELDKLWVFIPLGTGRRVIASRGSNVFVGVKIDEPFTDADGMAHRVRSAVAGQAREVSTWYELEMTQFKSFQVTKSLLVFIMALIVVVATANVSSSVVMIVLENVQEIGILKSMGSRPAHVRRIFLYVGLLAGLIGTMAGIGLGLLLAVNVNELIALVENGLGAGARLVSLGLRALGLPPIPADVRILNTAYYLEEIPIRVKPEEIVLIALGAVLLATAAAFFPARNAGRIRPLDVIRKR
jgi:lipoprotein-releasing system permease protein